MRRSCQRDFSVTDHKDQSAEAEQLRQHNKFVSAKNCVIFTIPVELILSLGVFIYALGNGGPDSVEAKSFEGSIIVLICAALIEKITETFYIDGLLKMDFSTRVSAEGAAILVKSCTIYLSLKVFGLELMAFALGHVAYSLALLVSYVRIYSRRDRIIIQTFFTIEELKISKDQYVLSDQKTVLREFSLSCFLKFLL